MSAGVTMFFLAGLAWSAEQGGCEGAFSKTQGRNDRTWDWEYVTDNASLSGRMLLHTQNDSFTLLGSEDADCVEEGSCVVEGLACILRNLLPIASDRGISIGRIQIESYGVYLLARPDETLLIDEECNELYSLYYERVLDAWTDFLASGTVPYRPISIHARDIKLSKPLELGRACFPSLGEALSPWNELDFFPVITVKHVEN